ncbi:signal peptidase II [Actinopolyspora mortivallis]|uniref:Lipoprotein signal peptidase n=1 Tax=Actinopolyspora mortivallis TaxID=33906 RepID=A0A2T0GZ49_ACTMO|nr:signal peptidase II [Actinopolyspora mortivallis]PRW64396.1 signal peptidase II [Actinopolyspora mortivallis]
MSEKHRQAGPGAGDGKQHVSVASRQGPRWGLLGLLFGIAAVMLVLDVLTKSLAVARLEGEPPVKLLGGALYLVLYRNPGAAFSIATGHTWVLALLAIAIVGAIVWFAPKLRSRAWAVGLGLVLGGAVGNLVDRIFRDPAPLHGHVIDFLSVFAPDGSVWPVFNLADSAIVCGGVLIVLLALLGRDYDGTVQRGGSRGTGRRARGGPTSERGGGHAERDRSDSADPERGSDEGKRD